MKILLFIVVILIIVFLLFVGVIIIIVIGGYAVAAGIGFKNQTENDAWNYWETIKNKKWDELTSEEKEKCVSAVMVIYADCGTCSTEEEVRHMLAKELPILEPKVGPPFPQPSELLC